MKSRRLFFKPGYTWGFIYTDVKSGLPMIPAVLLMLLIIALFWPSWFRGCRVFVGLIFLLGLICIFRSLKWNTWNLLWLQDPASFLRANLLLLFSECTMVELGLWTAHRQPRVERWQLAKQKCLWHSIWFPESRSGPSFQPPFLGGFHYISLKPLELISFLRTYDACQVLRRIQVSFAGLPGEMIQFD